MRRLAAGLPSTFDRTRQADAARSMSASKIGPIVSKKILRRGVERRFLPHIDNPVPTRATQNDWPVRGGERAGQQQGDIEGPYLTLKS